MDKAKTVSLHFTKEVRVDGKPTWSSTWHETQVPWSTLKSGSNVKPRDHDNFKNSQSLIFNNLLFGRGPHEWEDDTTYMPSTLHLKVHNENGFITPTEGDW